MTDRLAFLYPEMALFAGTCVVMVLGLSRTLRTRKASASVAAVSLIVAGFLALVSTPRPGEASCPITGIVFDHGLTPEAGQVLLPNLAPFMKVVIAGVGLLLLLTMAGTVDRRDEESIAAGTRTFDPLRSNRAEFYAFFLFSLTGLMLTASADDLIWLFLALELTSLPTYIMVAVSTSRNRSREAGVKYFFLGALGAAVFLYGFALIYGGTGSTNLNEIAAAWRDQGVGPISLAGILLAVVGLAFKIAAVPMHYYTPDVYEGAAPQVSGFLAFVPKAAGFIALLLVCAAVGWRFGGDALGVNSPLSSAAPAPARGGGGTQLPEVLRLTLWVMAALTMTVGNVLAVLQKNIKRVLAYSSIAHSGYMLVGVVAGPVGETFTRNGVGAVLFYIAAYGVMNTGAFAVLAALERDRDASGEPGEVETYDDLRGLCAARPLHGWTFVVCSLSLLGLPPLLGFFGKLPLFTAGIAANEIALVVILGVNSAIGAYYYLRLAFTPLLEQPEDGAEPVRVAPFRARTIAGAISAGGVLVLSVLGGPLMRASSQAATTKMAVPPRVETSDALGDDVAPVPVNDPRSATPDADGH
ncbi:MAG: NADH-quinone oxidoreductase subunit N [Planctomycetota bacterium]|nr:NADH-quinone oxidoreductase subunit N [Planctomycetota bacterium]